jgi:hypothetical protein
VKHVAKVYQWPQRLTAAMDILAPQQTAEAANMRYTMSEDMQQL